ncbi:MAG TPA: hypothetical protein DCQ50_00720 [Chryseobacterium sp.]|nr:hypothetical protein [Chryseobacterium sp.]
MASVSIIYRKDKKNKKQLAPIHLRIIKDRKISYIATGIMLVEDDWDFEKSKIKSRVKNSARLNSFISNKYAELQDQVLELETFTKSATTRQLKEKIYGKKPENFFVFAEEANKDYLINNQIGTYDKNASILKKLKEYVDNSSITFHDLTPDFLTKYDRYLRETLKNSINTVHKDMKFIRKLFNDAIRLDLVEADRSPFIRYKLKTEKTQRSYLTEDELLALEKVKTTPGTRLELHKDMFIFSSYSGGLRVSDVLQLQWKHFNGERIDFTIMKTGNQLSIKLPNKALDIIKKYQPKKADKSDRIFPILPNTELDARELDTLISRATAYINKNLKILANKAKIEKPVSFHISRHTWATRALRKGISIDKVSKLMGHAQIRETQIYAKIVNSELDKAMDVFND